MEFLLRRYYYDKIEPFPPKKRKHQILENKIEYCINSLILLSVINVHNIVYLKFIVAKLLQAQK